MFLERRDWERERRKKGEELLNGRKMKVINRQKMIFVGVIWGL